MNISISKDLIKSCKSARSSYQAFLEAQHLEKELEEKRQLEVAANKKVEEEKNEKKDVLKKAGIKVSEDVVLEGNQELGEIMKKKPFNEKKLKLCHAKIDMGLKRKNELQTEVGIVEKKMQKVERRT